MDADFTGGNRAKTERRNHEAKKWRQKDLTAEANAGGVELLEYFVNFAIELLFTNLRHLFNAPPTRKTTKLPDYAEDRSNRCRRDVLVNHRLCRLTAKPNNAQFPLRGLRYE